ETCDILACVVNLVVRFAYRTLIDVGAYFVNISASDVAKRILDALPAEGPVTCVVFIDNDNEKKAYVKGSEVVHKYTDITVPIAHRFVFFDQAHITGQDIPMYDKAKGLITIVNFNRWRDVAQGAFRMRRLNYGQSV